MKRKSHKSHDHKWEFVCRVMYLSVIWFFSLCALLLFASLLMFCVCASPSFFSSSSNWLTIKWINVHSFVLPISIIWCWRRILFSCPSPSQLKLEKVLLKLYIKILMDFLSDFIKRFIILCVCWLSGRARVCPTIHWLGELKMVYEQDMIVIHGDLLTVSFVDVVWQLMRCDSIAFGFFLSLSLFIVNALTGPMSEKILIFYIFFSTQNA